MKKSLPVLLAFALLPFAAQAPAQSSEKEADGGFYAQVAAQKFGTRMKGLMEKPGPAALPDKVLGWNGGNPAAPMEKIDTPEKLKAALAALREKMKPFQRELQPQLAVTRITQPVDKMQFRMEGAADRADFLYTLQGGGDWRTVAIPHYTGPGEQAVCWYRTPFTVTPEMLAKGRLAAHFNGVEYFADVFVNGHHVGAHEGYFAPFDCDFTPYAKSGENILLVRVRNSSRFTVGSSAVSERSNNPDYIPRTFGDKLESSNSPGWDDPTYGWNCTPNGFGISQGVTIEARAGRFIGDIFPRPILNPKEKAVEIAIEVENPSEQNGAAVLKISVHGRNFQAAVAENIVKKCTITGTRPIYRVKIPMPDAKLWTPEEPWLYQAQITLEDGRGKVLDTQERQFGMRTFEMKTDSQPIGRLFLNGREIRLRGANEMGNFQQDVLKRDWNQLTDDILLAKLTNMNFLRCTQTVMPPEFYDHCDRLGLMAQSDLPLFSKLSAKKAAEAVKQAGEMARIIRAHPSNCVASFFNEPDSGDGTGGHAFALNRAQVEEFFKAATVAVKLENPDQVIKLVDGDYNPPSAGLPDNHCYSGWYGQHGVSQEAIHNGHWLSVLKGWMYGCGEFGAEGLDSVALMKKRYPAAWIAVAPDGSWKPNKIRGGQTWDMYRTWFETPAKPEDWVKVSQTHQANVVRLKAEAFRRMPRMNTFAVHLFIDAWPDGWLKSIMDVERNPKKAWFAYRDALAPIAVQLRTPWKKNNPKLSVANCDTWSYQQNEFIAGKESKVELWICNDTATTPACSVVYQLEKDGKVLCTGNLDADMPTVTDGAKFQGFIPITGPAVAEPARGILRATLTDKMTGKTLDQYVFPCEFKPAN